jgi:hypothetical protein
MRRALIIIGVLILLIGIAWPWLTRGNWWRWIGHLPGDIHIEREGFSFHFPLMTCILVSLLVSLVIWLLRR